ncbi:MAG: MlaE family lipid ABC transporter permease subunit, partial [Campylobacterales bacterium]
MAQWQIERTGEKVTISCRGSWLATVLDDASAAFVAELSALSGHEVVFELSGVERIDTVGALLLQETERALNARGNRVRMRGADGDTQRVMTMTHQYAHPGAAFALPAHGVFESVGRQSADIFRTAGGVMAFVGQTFFTFLNILFSKGQLRLKEIAHQVSESAIKALGIVALTMFLVGVVVAYQSAVQLKIYGANIFIVDALGISIFRELAPMLTAIVVAGRSGSSYAAQIGVMKMTEEIDAMRTMGFDPYAFLVLPRMIALIIMMPILTFFADIFGMIGGMLIAHTELGLSATLFVDRFVEAVEIKHFWVGIFKGPFFAVLIASIGIYRGMQVKNDTESIGINTTKSV